MTKPPSPRPCAQAYRVTIGRGNVTARAGAALLRVRWFARAPIWLYRARLGAVLGSRLLMLEHVGRTSGRRRLVVLEVVDHPAPGRYVLVSGFGGHAQWFRNVTCNPKVRVFLASHRPAPALAHQLDADASAVALGRYANEHPRAWAQLRPVLEQTLGARVDQHGADLPTIAIDLVDNKVNSLVRRSWKVTRTVGLLRSHRAPRLPIGHRTR